MQLVSGMNRAIASQPAFVLTRHGVARLLNVSGREYRACHLRQSNHKPSLADESDRDGRGFDLDPSILPAHIKGCPRLQAGLTADLFGDDQATCRIHGRFHTVHSTMLSAIGTGQETVSSPY